MCVDKQEKRVLTIGIVGCGAIGSLIGDYVHKHMAQEWDLVAVCDHSVEQAQACAIRWGAQVMNVQDLVLGCDFVVEASRAAAMPDTVRLCLAAGKRVLAMSVGGFALEPQLMDEVGKAGGTVYVPSGAITGLDGVLALREQGLDTVHLTTIKHPRSLPEGVWDKGSALPQDVPAHLVSAQARCIFDGNAGDAIRAFPANVNISIALSLAGLGFERTHMRIVADPGATGTTHYMRAVAGQSSVETITRPQPLEENPRSSRLAVDSALALLRKAVAAVKVGT